MKFRADGTFVKTVVQPVFKFREKGLGRLVRCHVNYVDLLKYSKGLRSGLVNIQKVSMNVSWLFVYLYYVKIDCNLCKNETLIHDRERIYRDKLSPDSEIHRNREQAGSFGAGSFYKLKTPK